jgi:hypothetical protein
MSAQFHHTQPPASGAWAPQESALALAHFGDTRRAAGEPAQAREAWQQALAILDNSQHPNVGMVRAKLASTNHRAAANPSV